jgi:hypothetical protein
VVVSLAIVDSMGEVLLHIVFTPHVLIDDEDYCMFTKRKIQQETHGRSNGSKPISALRRILIHLLLKDILLI